LCSRVTSEQAVASRDGVSHAESEVGPRLDLAFQRTAKRREEPRVPHRVTYAVERRFVQAGHRSPDLPAFRLDLDALALAFLLATLGSLL
jgi:hypothetical protein